MSGDRELVLWNEKSPKVTTGANTRPTVTTGSTLILAANPNRKMAIFVNQAGKQIFLKFKDPAVVNQGIRMPDNSKEEINANNLWTGDVFAIVMTGTAAIEVFEGT